MPDFATLAERLSPVVVNISTRSARKEQPETPKFRGPGQGQQPQWPFGEGEPRDFTEPFEKFFGPGPHQRQQQNLNHFPHLTRWFETILARPAVERDYALAATINTAPVVNEQSRALLFGHTSAQAMGASA